ncbi:hypothetical protein GCM10010276_24480 [Streptomyces longisporus]|uniref:Uncharacterized protein n=1 Tax=Streptomyces longisporus TaxID=1948 RepID=A0ABN3LJU7_STRLO
MSICGSAARARPATADRQTTDNASAALTAEHYRRGNNPTAAAGTAPKPAPAAGIPAADLTDRRKLPKT